MRRDLKDPESLDELVIWLRQQASQPHHQEVDEDDENYDPEEAAASRGYADGYSVMADRAAHHLQRLLQEADPARRVASIGS